MRILEDVAVELPPWMRVALAVFGVVFGGLAWWLAVMIGEAGFLAGACAVLAGLLALILLVSALRGRIWKWMRLGG